MAAPAPTTDALPEAGASATAKVIYRGFDIMLTLRAHDGATLLPRLDAALSWLEDHGATPTTTRPPAATTAAHGANVAAPQCPTHGAPMQASKHGGGWYCPAKVADDDGTGKPSYCRHKVKAEGGAQ